jgi:hypothetical protein
MTTDKFVLALARHEIARQKVDALSRRIGMAINRCPIVIKSNDWSISNAERAETWDEKTQRHKTHLWMVYNARAVYGEHFDETGQEEALQPCNDGCRHCLRAFRLIKQRKDARKELGHARLSIRSLGKHAIKMLADQ